MTKALNPQRHLVGDRAVVNRDWIREFTRASVGSAARWYKVRDEQQFRDFSPWFQEEKASKVLKADPELYELNPADIVSINKAAEQLNFSGASVIRKYQQANPGYFPDSVGEVEGPTGRMIQAFRVGELQDFDRGRTGKCSARPAAVRDRSPRRPAAAPRPSRRSSRPS
ncbi:MULTISPECIES: hypothetical protein [Streptomyces]|uniref:hypothetical protein n=1 Tax=Streptomyces TaxID=1883 RepID=UPI002E2E3E1D|nr:MULTISPECIES: hypothetical protein [Streptomyces]